jgi:hypothetical protein
MDAITLKPTDVFKIKLGLKAADDVTVEPIPAGETFAVSSTDAAVVPGSIEETDPLNPLLVVNALMLPGPTTATGIVLSVTDSGGDTVYELAVNYPVPTAPGHVTADVANAVVTAQPAPTATAP